MPLGTAAVPLRAAAGRRAPAARLREAGAVHGGQDHHARLRHAVLGPVELSPPGAQPLGPEQTPRRLQRRRGRRAAAGYGPLHLGTDIGGSLRLPAGWCGIFSLKPSLGRMPIDPPYTGRAAGPMTRTVADAALMMQVLSQPDARDSMSLPYQPIDWDRL
jgi:aspartyl-tRNA(Asn)/glutamyl-tRNA(Gln) amidotransferase subunit A